MATTNKYFKVKNGLDVNSNATVDASGNANIAGNLTANTGFVSADTFRLDTTYAGGSAVVGEFSWDPDNETARLLLDGVNLQIGQEHIIRVKNASGSVAIPDRTPVMFAGATGDTVTVSPAVSSNVAVYPSDYMVGITTEEIPADGFGFVTQFGFINQVNTTAWTVGTLLYVDPATAGGLTSTRPSAPAWQTPIAAVTKQNGSAGRLLVRTIPGININRVEGVEITTPTTNDVLRINSSGIVVNSNLATANIANLASASTQTFTGNVAAANFSTTGFVSGLELTSTNSSGLEGGQINLAKPVTTNLSSNVIIDIYNDKLRFFESGGTNRGAYIELTLAGTGVGTNLLSGGTADGNYYPTSFSWTDGTTAGPTGNLAGTGMTTVAYSAIPSASNTVSGVVTTTTQTFAGNKTFSGNVIAAIVETTNNGNGTNFKVGDDAWIGDINIANTIRVKGLQNSNNGYIVFGDSDTKALGRAGTGALTFDGKQILTSGTLFRYKSGYYYSPFPIGNTGNSALTGGRMYFYPVRIETSTTITSLSIQVGTGVASSTARLGIYSDTDGLPSSLLVDAGAVDTASSGTKTISGLTAAVSPGIYWFVVSVSGSITVRCATNNSDIVVPQPAPFDAGGSSRFPYLTVTYGALPSTFTSGTWSWVGNTPEMEFGV